MEGNLCASVYALHYMLDSQKLHILGAMKLNFGKTSLRMVILVEGFEAGI